MARMGVDIPATALDSILRSQEKWESDKAKHSSKTELHKR